MNDEREQKKRNYLQSSVDFFLDKRQFFKIHLFVTFTSMKYFRKIMNLIKRFIFAKYNRLEEMRKANLYQTDRHVTNSYSTQITLII